MRATPVEVPLNFVLGTSAGVLRQVPLVLVDLETEEGVTGRSYLFCLFAGGRAGDHQLARGDRHAGKRTAGSIRPELLAKLVTRFKLIGVQGIVRMAIAGFDQAAWDAAAIAAGKPLATFLGARPRPIPAYNSCGLGVMADKSALADEAEKLLARGFRAVKLRLGYPAVEEDIAAVLAVRKRIGDACRADGRLQSGTRG